MSTLWEWGHKDKKEKEKEMIIKKG